MILTKKFLFAKTATVNPQLTSSNHLKTKKCYKINARTKYLLIMKLFNKIFDKIEIEVRISLSIRVSFLKSKTFEKSSEANFNLRVQAYNVYFTTLHDE